ncbi:MAG: hypothetical protein KJ047_13750 [Anaerolineae bacterium]|nr:hypothetical protein [Anaerolineae bacterium]
MVKRRTGYLLLAALAAVMLVRLMLDDPAQRLEQMRVYEATQEASRPTRLFATLRDPAQVTGLEVLDVSAGRGILLVRDAGGLWYAPEIAALQQPVAAESINQITAENTAAALVLLAATQQYPYSTDNLALYGLAPAPAYRVRFRAQDSASGFYEGLLEIGDANPDHMAYYVYVHAQREADRHIFLIPRQTVDYLVAVLTDPALVAPALDDLPAGIGTTPSVP